MARRFLRTLLIFAAIFAAAAAQAPADPPQAPPNAPPPRPPRLEPGDAPAPDRPGGKPKPKRRAMEKEKDKEKASDARKAREVFRGMTAGERRDFMENFRRWKEMPPERKQALLKRQETFRDRVKKDIEDAIAESGLELSEKEKREFAKRYSKGRREIEDALRRQMDELREPRLKALIESLKSEFASPAPEAKPGE